MTTYTRRHFMRTNLQAGGAVVLAAGLPGVLAACGGSDEDEGAPESPGITAQQVRDATGTVTVSVFAFYQSPALNKGKVTAKFVDQSTGEDAFARVRQDPPEFDIVNTAPNIMKAMYAIDRLAPIPVDAMANYGSIEQTLRDDPVLSRDGEVYAIPFIVTPGVTAWNAERVPEPTDAENLLSSDYEKAIGIADAPDNLVAIHRLLGNDITTFTLEDLDAVMEYLEQLRPNIQTLYVYGEDADLLARGDISVAFQTFGSILVGAQQANKDIQGNFTGSVSYADCFSIVEGADVAAATSWLDGTVSEAGQLALQKASASLPTVPSVTDAELLPPVLAGMSLADVLEVAPIDPGVPVEGEGLVTRDALAKAWNDFKAGF